VSDDRLMVMTLGALALLMEHMYRNATIIPRQPHERPEVRRGRV